MIVSVLIVSLERFWRRRFRMRHSVLWRWDRARLSFVPSRIWASPGIQHQAKGLARGVSMSSNRSGSLLWCSVSSDSTWERSHWTSSFKSCSNCRCACSSCSRRWLDANSCKPHPHVPCVNHAPLQRAQFRRRGFDLVLFGTCPSHEKSERPCQDGDSADARKGSHDSREGEPSCAPRRMGLLRPAIPPFQGVSTLRTCGAYVTQSAIVGRDDAWHRAVVACVGIATNQNPSTFL